MTEVAALVEGRTEHDFVNRLLRPHLGARNVHVWAVLPGREYPHGGPPRWEAARRDIVGILKSRRGVVCTTMFDFYGLPRDWPGRDQAVGLPLNEKGAFVERALLADVREFASKDFRPEWFIPYVQVHEFEALLFADVAILAQVLVADPARQVGLEKGLRAILHESGEPEAINDNWDTCPSRRIAGLADEYEKRVHGLAATSRIGLDVIRRACPHFGQWLDRLESLGTVE